MRLIPAMAIPLSKRTGLQGFTMISLTRMMARALLFVLTLLSLCFATGAQAQNNAAFVSQSVPTSMLTGATYNVTVTMTNIGGTTWSAANSHFLGSQNPENNSTWGGGRVAMPMSVGPGGQASLAFQITAPSMPGTYNFQWRMLQEGVEWFGPFTPNVTVAVSAPTPGNGAQVIGVGAPSVMTQGQSYTVGVTLRNSGATTWPAGSAYALGSTSPHNTMLWGVNRTGLPIAVAPGQRTTFSFQVTAPAAGSYTMGWGMVQENVEWFGATSNSAVTVNLPGSGAGVTYIHTDGLGSPVARTDANGAVISRTRYEPYGLTAGGATPTIGFTGHVNDADTGLVYMQQRYYDPVAGRFLSIDPVTTDANSGNSFNRYAYANDNPYKYVDPDGRNPALAACAAGPIGCAVGVGLTAITAYQVWKAARETSALLQSRSEPKKSDSDETPKSDTTSGDTNNAPAVPSGLVGDQSNSRSGQRGKRHTSGMLTPENGGTGDAQKDFDHLTGGTGQPAPTPNTYPPGTQVGANEIVIRPGKTGTSIDIPKNGSKPPETLHYPDVK